MFKKLSYSLKIALNIIRGTSSYDINNDPILRKNLSSFNPIIKRKNKGNTRIKRKFFFLLTVDSVQQRQKLANEV